MSKWIEDAKRFYQTTNMKAEADEMYFIMALEDKCYEKGYSLDETQKIVRYVTE